MGIVQHLFPQQFVTVVEVLIQFLQSGCPFDGQRMKRNVVCAQIDDLAHALHEILVTFFRKSGDQIRIDDRYTALLGNIKGFVDIFHRMFSADQIQSLLLRRLRIDTDAVHTVIQKHADLILCNGVRPPCLNGELSDLGKVKALFRSGQQLVQLFGIERRRRSATEVNGFDLVMIRPPLFIPAWRSVSNRGAHVARFPACRSALSQHLSAGFDLRMERLQVPIDLAVCHLIRCEGAVQTSGRTKRNADVHRQAPQFRFADLLLLIVQNLLGQSRLCLMQVIVALQDLLHTAGVPPGCRTIRHVCHASRTGFLQFPRQFHRPDSGQNTPLRFLARECRQIVI